MPTDNARHLTRAAHARAEQTRRRAVAALRQLTNSNQALTVAAVAQQASVSRSWLYTQPDLLHQIREHRPQTAALVTVPRRQAATDASLKQRLQLAHLRIRELEADNQQLRHTLAQALGDQRARHARQPPQKHE
jgi:hypothetical protein